MNKNTSRRRAAIKNAFSAVKRGRANPEQVVLRDLCSQASCDKKPKVAASASDISRRLGPRRD